MAQKGREIVKMNVDELINLLNWTPPPPPPPPASQGTPPPPSPPPADIAQLNGQTLAL